MQVTNTDTEKFRPFKYGKILGFLISGTEVSQYLAI